MAWGSWDVRDVGADGLDEASPDVLVLVLVVGWEGGAAGAREGRGAEALAEALCRDASLLGEGEGGQTAPPLVLFGHSGSAWVAFEACRVLRERGAPAPALMVVSALPPPTLPPERRPWRPHAALPAAEARAELVTWGWRHLAADAAWESDGEALVADFSAWDDSAYAVPPEDPPLRATPIVAFAAERDAKVLPAQLELWGSRSTCGATTLVFPGDHYYVDDRALTPHLADALVAQARIALNDGADVCPPPAEPDAAENRAKEDEDTLAHLAKLCDALLTPRAAGNPEAEELVRGVAADFAELRALLT